MWVNPVQTVHHPKMSKGLFLKNVKNVKINRGAAKYAESATQCMVSAFSDNFVKSADGFCENIPKL
jgi:hypothetical protein